MESTTTVGHRVRASAAVCLAAGVISLLARCSALAQNGPDNDADVAQGYVNSIFHHNDVDSINLYSGQLTIPVPLGPSYPIGPKLRLQLMLTYSSRKLEGGQPSGQPQGYFYSLLVGDPAIGLGWTFTLGAIKMCKQGNTLGECYVAPDGSQHIFNLPRGTGKKTSDGTQYFLTGSGPYDMWDGDGNHYVFGSLQHVSGFDDPLPIQNPGYIHDFGRGRDGWYLTSVTDPFGNSYSVTYQDNTTLNPAWTYNETTCALNMKTSPTGGTTARWSPKTITFNGTSITVGTSGNKISKVTFPVLVNGASTTRDWTFTYDSGASGPVLQRNCDTGGLFQVNLDVLRTITLPSDDSTSAPTYQFDYDSGLLTEMILPTGGTIDYCYGLYTFFHGHNGNMAPNCSPVAPPTSGLNVPDMEISGSIVCHTAQPEPIVESPDLICSSDRDSANYVPRFKFQTLGVTQRNETLTGPPAVTNTTDYTQYAFPFGEQGSVTSVHDAETLTVVLSPPTDMNATTDTGQRRAKAVRFNSTTKGQIVTSPGDRLGADVEERIFDGNPNDGSITMPACGTAPERAYCSSQSLRTTFRTYDYDNQTSEYGDRRLSLENTIFGAGTCGTCPNHQVDYQLTASDCTTPVSGMCDWDSSNGRHYNKEVHTGSENGVINRMVTTFWDPQKWDGSGGTVLPNEFKKRTEAEGSSSVVRRFEFDSTSGFLNGTSNYDPVKNVALVNCRFNDGAGNPGSELTKTLSSQPSDTQCVSDYSNAFPGAGLGVGTNGDLFGKAYTYQHGELTSARWVYDDITLTNTFFFRNYQRDSKTGWIKSSTDTSGLTTSYQYDNFGRIRLVTPPSGSGDLSTFVCYEGATATSAYRASSILTCPVAGTAAVTTWQHYDYDGLGRTVRERRRLANATLAERFTLYDGRGNAKFSSEWVANGSSESVAGDVTMTCTFQSTNYSTKRPSTAPGTYRMCVDPFGRPQEIIGAKHTSRLTVDRKNGTEWYSDTKEAASTLCINGSFSSGSCSGGSTSLTTTWRDAFGRTTEVDEPSAVGTNTTYTYDVNGKLLSAKQGSQAQRTFGYDTLGFLRTETSLEQGAVAYNTIGSLGNVLSETEPDLTVVSRTFDFAGRLAEVDAGGNKYIVNCYDGSSSPLPSTNCVDGTPNNPGGTNRNGKLTRRYGYNWIPTPGPTVDEQFDYTDTAGRLHSITTTVGNGDLTTTATETWTYTTLGLVNQHNHPRRSGDAAFPVTYAYDAGLPTSVTANSQAVVKGSPNAATYNLAGGLATWTAGNTGTYSVVTTITQDASGLPRPSQIKAVQGTGGSSTRFDTGTYAYDGGGNVTSMSDPNNGGTFGYDSLSRVTSSVYSVGTKNFAYDTWGNLTQNGSLVFGIDTTKNQVNCGPLAYPNCSPPPPGVNRYDGRGNNTWYNGDTATFDLLDRKTRNQNASSDWVNVYSGADERVVKFPGNTSLVRREMARLVGEANKAAGKTGWSTAPDSCHNLFTDVPCPNDPDSRWIETLVNHGIAAGYGGGLFGPDDQLKRAQMAAFVVKGYKTEPYTPPACQGIFADVPCNDPTWGPFAPYIEVLYNEGVTAGCNLVPLNFCPGNPVTPWQILVWMTKTPSVPGGVAWGTVYHPVPRGSIYTLRDEQNRVVTELTSTTSGTASASATIGRDNVFFGSLMVGTNSAGIGWQYVISDHLGSTRRLLSSSGAVAESHQYWPYGEDTNTGPPTQKLAFAQMERNDGAARYFDHARHHDYNLARFVSPDRAGGRTANPQFWNRYVYASNNPIKFVDRTGLDFVLAGCAPGSTQTNCDYQKNLLKQAVGDKAFAYLQFGKEGKVTFNGITASQFARDFGTVAHGLAYLIKAADTYSLQTGFSLATMLGSGGARFGNSAYVDGGAFPKTIGGVEATAAEAVAHELGHLVAKVVPGIAARIGRQTQPDTGPRVSIGEGFATAFENQYRREIVGSDKIRAYYNTEGDYIDPGPGAKIFP